jgi:hypothetical protein
MDNKVNIRVDRKRDWWRVDVGQILHQAKSAYFARHYGTVGLLCGEAVNALILDLYMHLLPLVSSTKERLSLVSMESKIGEIQRFSFGQTVRLAQQSRLFEKAEEVYGIDLGEAKALDYTLMVLTRNKAAHSAEFDDANAVGAVLFQTQTLYQVLRMISAETVLLEEAVQKSSAPASPDQIEYLNAKLVNLRNRIETKAKTDSSTLLNLADSIQESLEITRINQEDALFKLRKILERICAEVYRDAGGDPAGRMLDWLMQKISERGLIPNKVFKHMSTVKSFGNAGAHPSGEKYEIQDFEAVFISLIVVVDWYMGNVT